MRMSLMDRFRMVTHAPEFAEAAANQTNTLRDLQERIAELELTAEDAVWEPIGSGSGNPNELSLGFIKSIVRLARINWAKNPIIRRGVSVQCFYVFGQGVTIRAQDQAVNEVIQAFWDDPRNKAELTGHQARMLKEQDLQVIGNLFFTLFTNNSTGQVVIRTIPFEEIDCIISNPDDSKTPFFYKRCHNIQNFNPSTGTTQPTPVVSYYPDWGYDHPDRPATIAGSTVHWESPIYHVKVGGMSDWKFGVPEVFPALDWARAYKEFLEDWATITRALARFAWDYKTDGGQRGAAAIKNKLQTLLGAGSEGVLDRNPPPLAGSMHVHNAQGTLAPVRTAGATTGPEEGRRISLMSIAALGLPETFFGDASVGSLATARSLDRPTELKFRDRQTLWTEVISNILNWVVDRAAEKANGPLTGKVQPRTSQTGEPAPIIDFGNPNNDTGITDRTIEVKFSSILEHDITSVITAITTAATLNGNQLAGTLDLRTVVSLLFQELSIPNADLLLEELFPSGEYDPKANLDKQAEDIKSAAAKPTAGDNFNPKPNLPDPAKNKDV